MSQTTTHLQYMHHKIDGWVGVASSAKQALLTKTMRLLLQVTETSFFFRMVACLYLRGRVWNLVIWERLTVEAKLV